MKRWYRCARRELRRVAAGVAVATALAGCGGARSAHASAHASSTPGSSRPPSSGPALPQPSQRCGTPDTPALILHFRAADGVQLDGALLGSGPVGAVLLHEYPGPMCGWWPYAVYLAQHGIHVLLFDFRCLGLSACPPGGRADPVADTAGAMRSLRSRGARSIALIGASLGGVVAVLAGAHLRPAAIVDLSGERNLTGLLPGPPLDAFAAGPGVRAVALFVVARADPRVTVGDMRAVFAHAGARDKQLLVLPADAGHGWDMLTGSGGDWSPLAGRVLRFITTHARP
jgi:alpha/beta superfamily hydrolase